MAIKGAENMSVAFIRTIIIYIIVVLALRIMGKRQLGELQPSELVVTILVSNLATMSIEDNNVPMIGTVIPIFTLVSCEIIISYIIMKSSFAQKMISGNPRVIIRDGKIDQGEMRNLRWTIEDLTEQLRANGVFDINEVAFAIVETSGSLSVYQKFCHRPLSPDMQANPDGDDMPPALMISDGKIVTESLDYCGVDRGWVEDVIKRKHLDIKKVFIMTCDRNREYKIIKKEEK
jgi:uncharacterized membrane protein YcaP (DUF421 family)